MQTEIEVKFLSVDIDDIRVRLKKLGAKCSQPMQELERVNMNFADKKLADGNGWVRVRTDGKKTKLAYKELSSWSLHGVKEVEVTVSDYYDTIKLLESIGLKAYSHQVTKRETWEIDGTEVVIDIWPWVKPYIEIEGSSEEDVRKVAKDLGFDWENAVFGSVEPVFVAEFDMTIQDFYKLDEINFVDDMPDWLEKRRKK